MCVLGTVPAEVYFLRPITSLCIPRMVLVGPPAQGTQGFWKVQNLSSKESLFSSAVPGIGSIRRS